MALENSKRRACAYSIYNLARRPWTLPAREMGTRKWLGATRPQELLQFDSSLKIKPLRDDREACLIRSEGSLYPQIFCTTST
jgi:hypothetical protein